MAKKEVSKTNKNDKNDKNKKTFFKSFKTELKKVVWPTPKQLVNNTVTVITIVILCAAIVFVLDLLFETINKQGIERVRNLVVTEQNNTTQENTTNSEEQNSDNGNSDESSEGKSTTIKVNEDGSVDTVDGDGSLNIQTTNEENEENADNAENQNSEAESSENSAE